jgi:hypothetical protein
MIYDDSQHNKRKPYRVYTTEVQTEARALVCLVCLASFTVSAYVGEVHTRAEKCPKCGCVGGVEKFGMIVPPVSGVGSADRYLVLPDDEIQQYVREVNDAIYPH